MARKLVTIQQIKDISPIKNADKIEIVHINGWQCVSKKGEFNVGDLCVYFEIDSFLLIDDVRFDFLKKSSNTKMNGKEGIRLKTMKLRGVISSGLALPISLFPELAEKMVGEDVSDILNVVKYEAPISAQIGGNVAGKFPSFIPKTDEERIQNLPEYFENDNMKDIEFEETLKLDGTSMTVFRTDGSVENITTSPIEKIKGLVGVCMRNFELKYNFENSLWKKALDLNLPTILSELNLEIAIQGELIGSGIQKNREQLHGHEFFVFRIWDIKNQRFYTPGERIDLINKINETYNIQLKHVPVINKNIKIFNIVHSVEEMLKRADGQSLTNPVREGIVFKSINNFENGQPVTFKAISNLFLLKGGD